MLCYTDIRAVHASSDSVFVRGQFFGVFLKTFGPLDIGEKKSKGSARCSFVTFSYSSEHCIITAVIVENLCSAMEKWFRFSIY